VSQSHAYRSDHLVPKYPTFSALRMAWLAHLLRRTIVDVARSDEQAYRDFGLDRDEVLKALRHLQDNLGKSNKHDQGRAPPLAIAVRRRRNPSLASTPRDDGVDRVAPIDATSDRRRTHIGKDALLSVAARRCHERPQQ
jgi:hypothetical protein